MRDEPRTRGTPQHDPQSRAEVEILAQIRSSPGSTYSHSDRGCVGCVEWCASFIKMTTGLGSPSVTVGCCLLISHMHNSVLSSLCSSVTLAVKARVRDR